MNIKTQKCHRHKLQGKYGNSQALVDRSGEKGADGGGGVKKCILGVGLGGGKGYDDFSCRFRIV